MRMEVYFMNINDPQKFNLVLKETVEKRLGDGYDVSFSEVKKITESYPSLCIMNLCDGIGYNINLEQLYGYYREGKSTEECADEIIERITGALPFEVPDWLTDYDRVKPKLFIRVSDAEKNREILEDVPHHECEGLAVTCHILIHKGKEFASAMITKPFLKQYGISAEQLYEDAVKNSERIMPAQIVPLDAACRMNDSCYSSHALVLTNQDMINGAAVVFYPGILEETAGMLGESFWLFPSSIHEMIAFASERIRHPDEAKEILTDANRTVVSEEDQLSDTVYFYDAEEHRLHKAA